MHDADLSVIKESLPLTHDIAHAPRLDIDGNPCLGGGVAIIFLKTFHNVKLSVLPETVTAFEGMTLQFRVNGVLINFAIIYRPGHPGTDRIFLTEFDNFLTSFFTPNALSFISGDFNYWVDDPSGKPYSQEFLALLTSHNVINLISEPTHSAGHILDLFLSTVENGFQFDELVVHPIDDRVSDHAFLSCKVNLPVSTTESKKIKFRSYRNIEKAALISAIDDSLHSLTYSEMSSEELVSWFNSRLSTLHDEFVPVKEKIIKVKDSKPWYDGSVAHVRRERRKAERNWRRHKDEQSRASFIEARYAASTHIEMKKSHYFNDKILDLKGNQKQLWRIFSSLLGGLNGTTTDPSNERTDSILASKFNNFFIDKVGNIRADIDDIKVDGSQNELVQPVNVSPFCQFMLITLEEANSLLKEMNITYCISDPFNFAHIPDLRSLLSPIFTEIANKCFSEGLFPISEKVAIVKPLLKKSSLDPKELKNYRPVSNLSVLSKFLEKCILKQLSSVLQSAGVIPMNQSAYRQLHSTETALCKIYNDLTSVTCSGYISLLVLLDLSAAFDTIDHSLLLDDLKKCGISGTALSLLRSYLVGRHQKVQINDSLSESKELKFGVPQGSVLGPVLFTVYVAGLSQMMEAHEVSYHCYADDTQIYFSIENASSSIEKLNLLISDIKKWMVQRKLKLNDGKTEYILIGGRNVNLAVPDFQHLACFQGTALSTYVRNIGVIFDSSLSFNQHISEVIKVCNFHLRRISGIRKYLDRDSLATLVHAFIISRIDYCNSLFVNLPKTQLKRLQLLLNKAARLILNVGPFDHISGHLIDLHWLPVLARVEFKICLLVFKCLKFNQPLYLCQLLTPHGNATSMFLRSDADPLLLEEPRAVGDRNMATRSFAYCAPRMYNKLPLLLRQSSSLECFKKNLKTFLFQRAYNLSSRSVNDDYAL